MATMLWGRADNGVTGGTIDASPAVMSVIAAFTAVAWYNVMELNMKIFLTFKRHRGLYFWSLLICSWGIAIHALSFILKFFVESADWIMYSILTTIGWYAMVTGQSVVLYSRLHLVLRNPLLLRFILIMICADVALLHVPTTVFTFGSNSPGGITWVHKFNVMERIQMTGFCIQEFIISCIYIWATLKLLKPIYHGRTRKIMTQLIAINVMIILMDVVLLADEYSGYYEIEASLKSMVYSLKLKLEFAILNQLMILANSGLTEGAMRSTPHLPEVEQTDKDRSNSIATMDSANAAASDVGRHPSEMTPYSLARTITKDPSRRKWSVPSLDRHLTRNWILKTQDVKVSSEAKRRSHAHGSAPLSPMSPVSHAQAVPDFITAPDSILKSDKSRPAFPARRLTTNGARLDKMKPIRSNRPSVEEFGPRTYSPAESEIELKTSANKTSNFTRPSSSSSSSRTIGYGHQATSPIDSFGCQTSLSIPATAEEASAMARQYPLPSHRLPSPKSSKSHLVAQPILPRSGSTRSQMIAGNHSGAVRPRSIIHSSRASVEDFGAVRDDVDPDTGTIDDDDDDYDEDMFEVETYAQAKRDIEGGRPPRIPHYFS